MRTHDIGPAFFQFIRLEKGAPLIHCAPTTELEDPYRESNSLVLRLPFRRGLVVGWWQESGKNEWEALTTAIHASSMGYIDQEGAVRVPKKEMSRNYLRAAQNWTVG